MITSLSTKQKLEEFPYENISLEFGRKSLKLRRTELRNHLERLTWGWMWEGLRRHEDNKHQKDIQKPFQGKYWDLWVGSGRGTTKRNEVVIRGVGEETGGTGVSEAQRGDHFMGVSEKLQPLCFNVVIWNENWGSPRIWATRIYQ